MGLLALAIAPGIFICWYIYAKDRYNKEPKGLLLWAFVLGMLSTLPAIVVQLMYTGTKQGMFDSTMATTAFFAYGIVGLSEEGSKFLMTRLFLYPRRAFDDPFDGIVYAVIVSMGFATLENVGYVYKHGIATGVLRMFLAVPAHATFGVLMGYFIGLAKFNPNRRFIYFVLAIVLPVLFHGSYDFFLFMGGTALNFGGAVASFIVAVWLSRLAIKHKQQLSKAHIEQTYDTTIQRV